MDINQPELKLFKKNYIAGKNQLLFHTFAADVHTPVSALIKLKEEALETVEAAEKDDVSQIIYESADLIYHLLVLLKKFDIDPEQVYEELEKREGKTGLRN